MATTHETTYWHTESQRNKIADDSDKKLVEINVAVAILVSHVVQCLEPRLANLIRTQANRCHHLTVLVKLRAFKCQIKCCACHLHRGQV